MGAVPSRETVEHWLSQPPFYGQRQDVVLIPLLKKFFPSPDCHLFVQLYEARCDPAVRYYYYANDGISKVQSTPTTPVSPAVYAAHEGVGNVASPTYLAEVIGNAPIYCPPADVFPSVNLTREAMYDAYITNGGERMVYETDEEMLRAYRADATSVRPLPCAVAFLYHRQASAVSPATSSAGDVDCEGSADAAFINETVAVGACSFPEDCTEVLGCYVKATGFIGDVHGLGASCPRKLPYYEMQMFLTKSAGDHHRTHVLLTAVYTYAEQWQRACLHCVPCDLTAKELAPAATKNGDTAGKNLGDAFFYYKPFSQSHHMLVEANRIAGHNRTAKSAAAERNGGKSGTLEVDEKTRFWAPPPLPSLVMRSRRANVPLLCFLREMRTCARSFFLSHFKYSLEHQDLLKPGCGGSTGGADGGPDRQTENNHLTTPLDHGAGASCSLSMPPLGSVQMWLQRATRVSASLAELSDEGSSTDTESVLNFHVVAPYVRALSEFIVACLLHNINPLEVSRLSSGPDDSAIAAASTGDDSKDATATGEAPATDAVGGSAFFFTSTTDAAMMAANPPFPQSFSFIRLPDEDMLVQPWPPSSSGCETGDEASTSTAAANAAASPSSAELLSVWRSRHTNHHLFWSVGPSIVNRRTATAALLHWYRTEKAPVVWGCNLDEKDCEMVAEGKESATASCNVSAAAFPSSSLESYMSTVTVNGQEEELLRCNTVLSLMRLETGMPAEARVLRVCRIPLEELLLGELRNSSKLAREAGPEDPHWVRQADSTSGGRGATKYACCVLHASDPAEGESRTTIASKGVELPTVPPEADGIIGDGSSCLWRVTLIDRMCRIIAVTPQFLKSIRKKHPKKKKTQPKVVIVHGTAAHVFLPVVSLSPTAASPTSVSPNTTAPAQKGVLELKESETTPARASVVTSPDRQSTVAVEEARPGGTVAVPDPLAPDATTATTAYASAAAATQAKKKTQQMANVAAAPGVASTSTVTESKAGDTVGHPPAAGAANMAVSTDPAAVVTQLKSTKGAKTTPAETKKAGAARRGSSETVTHTTAVADDKQRKSSASFTSIAPAATKAKTIKPTARVPGASTTSEKANEVKAGNASSGSSAAGAAETFATTTPTAKYATIPTAERPKKTSSLPRPPQPPVPAGEYDSSSKRDKAGAGGKHPVPSAASSVGGTSSFSGASATACAPPHPPGGSYYPHPPFYEAKTLQQLLRDPYEQHGYGYRVPPPPLPFAAPHSSSNATPSYVGYYYSPDGYQLHAGYCGGFYTNINGAGYYNTDMCGGAAATADVGKHMGGSGYGDSPYVYVAQPQQLQALPPLCQQRQHTGTTGEIRSEGLFSHEQSYSLPAKEEGNGYEAIPTAAPGSRQGSACSLRHHVSFEAGVGLLKEAVGDKAGLSSPRREATLLRPGGLCSGSSPISLASPNAQSPNHHHASPMPSTLRLQGSDIGELTSHDFEYHHNASVSGTGSHLHFQLDEFNSPVTNDSSIAMSNGHNWDHTRHVSSPCQTSTIIMEDAGVPWVQGCSSVGGSVNVTVRVRHHHNRTHSHAASYLSDATLDSLSTYHHHHDMTHHMNRSTSVASGRGLGGGGASLNGAQMSHSCASLDHSLNALHRLSGTGCGSLREYSIAAEGDHRHQASSPREHHEHENRHHEPGVMASSTRSGDTASAARRTGRRTGTYRWDWRTASLDMGYED
ncbi:conserved hypothetical protein [Leishmania mexicana MHOM/GT/2001/U1103]|uniref:Uncharacterized protein n=1 Tax=Leishmania mexicana (strain MHOM/GT/2001/U1103) TaxID=929439 RepID=E9B1V1_LEIMU|nr:conserved hypothetical protein [Leishmania mexicana MHOM/GT/2001/U1103]CBZ29208.1 conserved hypothetical protein [Leishmania mexicana MHOM/GT/2001/U1103]